MTQFRFMQQVVTPRGPGFFIGYLTDGFRCQVAMTQDSKPNLIFSHHDVTTPTGAKNKRQNDYTQADVSEPSEPAATIPVTLRDMP